MSSNNTSPSPPPSNLDTQPYNGSWEASHRTELITSLVLLMALLAAIPAALLIRRCLRQRAGKAKTREFAQRAAQRKNEQLDDTDDDQHDSQPRALVRGSDTDLERGISMGFGSGSPVPVSKPEPVHPAGGSTAGHAEVREQIRDGGESDAAPKGMWESIAAKRAG